jgi:hypothetical protein
MCQHCGVATKLLDGTQLHKSDCPVIIKQKEV